MAPAIDRRMATPGARFNRSPSALSTPARGLGRILAAERREDEEAHSMRAAPGGSDAAIPGAGSAGHVGVDNGPGSPEHDVAAGHPKIEARPKWQRVGAQSRELRRGDGESISRAARRAHLEERAKGDD